MVRAKGTPRVPERVAGCDVRKLPLEPVDAFVLSAIDGLASEEDVVAITGLPAGEVARRLRALAEWGAVRIPGESIAVRPVPADAPRDARVATLVSAGAPEAGPLASREPVPSSPRQRAHVAVADAATRVVDWYADDRHVPAAAPLLDDGAEDPDAPARAWFERSGTRPVAHGSDDAGSEWGPPTRREPAPNDARPRRYTEATRAVQWGETDALLRDLEVADEEEPPPPAIRPGAPRSRR